MTEPAPADSSILNAILSELHRLRAIDFRGYRTDFLARRLTERMAQADVADLPAYLAWLRQEPAEVDRLIDALGINVSHFFRDPMVFELLAQTVLPQLLAAKRARRARSLRVWSAGCAAGEEAYSVAILLQQALARENGAWESLVFATDIDPARLERGRAGIYPRESLAEVRLGQLDRYFDPCDEGFQVREELRRRVHFSRDDLTSAATAAPAESVFGSFDLVLCRNLLIYFETPLRLRVLDKLLRALAPGGYLVLGETEWLDGEAALRLTEVDRRNRIYRKDKGARE